MYAGIYTVYGCSMEVCHDIPIRLSSIGVDVDSRRDSYIDSVCIQLAVQKQ